MLPALAGVVMSGHLVVAGALLAQEAPPLTLDIPRSVSTAPHPATIEEVLGLREITALALSPDGRQVAFAVRQARPEQDAYAVAVFVAPAGVPYDSTRPPRKLADVPEVLHLAWTGNGRDVTYLASDGGPRQVWRVRVSGGRPQRLTDNPLGVASGLYGIDLIPEQYAVSPDGRHLAYFTWDTTAALAAFAARWRDPVVVPTSDVIITNYLRPDWRTTPVPAQLWLRDLRTNREERVWQAKTGNPLKVIPPNLAWSPDSRAIAFTYFPDSSSADSPTDARDIGLVRVADRSFRPLLTGAGYTIQLRWLPEGDGVTVFSVGMPTQGEVYSVMRWYEYRLADSSFRPVAEAMDLGEQAARAMKRRRPEARVTHCTVGTAGARAACVLETSRTPPEVAVADLMRIGADSLDASAVRVVTALNPEFRNIRTGDSEYLTFQSGDGVEESALLVRPVDFDSTKRYPLLVMLYRQGQKNRFPDQAWSTWPIQAFAAKGYAMVLPNPGHRPYREGDFPGVLWAEAEGPVALVDSAIRRAASMGIADTTRMGILGLSWGSYITSYLISHHGDRFGFKAANSSEGQLLDPGTYWTWDDRYRRNFGRLIGGGPYPAGALSRWIELSAAMYGDRVRTPVLQEYSSLNPGGLEFNVAVNHQGGAAELVVYKDERHVFEGPRNRLSSMHLNYDWFNFWVLGEEDPAPAKRPRYQRWRAMQRTLEAQEASLSTARAPR